MSALMTVKDLVSMPTLGQRLLAGGAGEGRVVLWAHTCEMPDPWRWLGPDELLMTTGLCIPHAQEAQVEFIRKLSDARLAGVTIGEEEMAPPLHPAMLREADRLAFPVLSTSHPVPFVTVARTVSMASDAQQNQQLLLLSRLYRSLTAVAPIPTTAIRRMEGIFGVRMSVVDVTTGAELVPGSMALDREVAEELRRASLRHEGQPGSMHTSSAGSVRAWSLPSGRAALLLVGEDSPMLDSFTIGHLQQAMTAAVNNVVTNAMAQAASGEQLVSSVLTARMPFEHFRSQSHDLGLVGPEYVTIAVATEKPSDQLIVLSAAGIAHLPHRTPARLTCYLNAADLSRALELPSLHQCRIGVSPLFDSLDDLAEAGRKAAWALGSATERARVIHYETVRGSVVPRDSQAAHEVSHGVLGDLLEPTERNRRLLKTLATYLANDRKWTETATALGIHRQTLAHRLRQIEELTSRSLKASGDLAALWVAISALDFLATPGSP